MATRQETHAKREALKKHLREISQQAAGPSQAAPTVRKLAAQWNLSVNLVLDAQRELVAEGILHVAPRVGTFVGKPEMAGEVFLFVFGPEPLRSPNDLFPKAGFEDRVAQLGGAVLTLNTQNAIDLQKSGELGPISGVFDYSTARGDSSAWREGTAEPTLPRVRFGSAIESESDTDFVSFEDEKGGWQATRHLMARQHERIAFLAFHPGLSATPLAHWSVEREEGWRRAMREAGLSTAGLAFHPQTENLFDKTEAIRDAMRHPLHRLLANPGITAVVTANDTLAECLLDALHAAKIPAPDWPSIVSFDGGTTLDSHIITSLRVPWDDLGRAAADLLWSRAHQFTTGQSQHRQVAMRLIPRLTCHTGRDYVAARTSLSSANRAALV